MTDFAESSPPGLHVTPQEWQIIRRILQQLLTGYTVWAFGSRVGGPCKAFSDLDLVVISDRPLPLPLMAELSEAFGESDLRWKVDIVDWATTNTAFQQRIMANKLALQ